MCADSGFPSQVVLLGRLTCSSTSCCAEADPPSSQINLPPGAVTMVIIVLWCNPPPIKQTLNVRQRIARMDWTGAALLLGACICLLIALQEGGILTPWRSAKIIGLLVGFVLLLIAFFILQVWLGDSGSISTRLFRNRSIAFTALENFCCGATYYSVLYYVPICALHGASLSSIAS